MSEKPSEHDFSGLTIGKLFELFGRACKEREGLFAQLATTSIQIEDLQEKLNNLQAQKGLITTDLSENTARSEELEQEIKNRTG